MSSPDAHKTFLEKSKDALAFFASNAKAAAQIAVKQAERLKINQVTLPNVYLALGKDIHAAGRYRDEFADLYAKVDEILGRILNLRQTQSVPSDQPQKLINRAKAAAEHASDLTKAKALDMKVTSIFRELGKKTFEKHKESSGPALLIGPICTALSRLEQLGTDIRQISESHAGGFLTPRRLLVGGAVAISVIGLLLIACLFTGGPSPIFDVPTLVGKDINGIQAVLGTPTEDDSDVNWSDGEDDRLKCWTKGKVSLMVSFHRNSNQVIDFFITLDDSSSGGTTDKKRLLSVGKLKEGESRYRIEYVFAIGEPGVYAGVKAIPKNAYKAKTADKNDKSVDTENRARQESKPHAKPVVKRWTLKKVYATTTRQEQERLMAISLEAAKTGFIDPALPDMIESGQIIVVPSGTEIDVIQSDALYREVRIKEGAYKGRTVWVLSQALTFSNKD